MSDGSSDQTIHYSAFAIHTKPHCVWEWDLPDRNRQFLATIDPDFFTAQAAFASSHLDSAEKQHAALSVRLTYGLAAESFFAILFACLQAPDCVPGWLSSYQPTQLLQLVHAISNQQRIRSKISITASSWSGVATAVHRAVLLENSELGQTVARVGDFWSKLARDFTVKDERAEFNSIKHGLRLRSGGFSVRIGATPRPALSRQPKRMVSLGGSEYGSSFFRVEKLSDDGTHFRIRRHKRNWSPPNFLAAIDLMAMSVANIISSTKLHLGEDPSAAPFSFPNELSDFDAPWRPLTGPLASDMDRIVRREQISKVHKGTDTIGLRI